MNDFLQIQELAIAIATKNHNPAVLTPEFLKYSGVVPEDWQLAREAVTTNRGSQVSFQNGVNIVAQPNQIIFAEPIAAKEVEEIQAPQVAKKYIQTLPKGDYQAVGINLRDYVHFQRLPQENAANNYIIKTLLAAGPWLDFGTSPVKAAIQLVYTLDRCECQLSINQATIQLPEQESIPVVVFSANFSYNVAENGASERLQALCDRIEKWQIDRETFSEIVNNRFLAAQKSLQIIS